MDSHFNSDSTTTQAATKKTSTNGRGVTLEGQQCSPLDIVIQQSTVPPHVSDYQSIAEARPQMSQDNRLPLPAGNSTVWRNKEENSTHQYGKPFRAYLGEHATRYYRGSHPIGLIQPKHQFTCPYHGPGKPGPQGQRLFTFSLGGGKPTMPFGDLVLLR